VFQEGKYVVEGPSPLSCGHRMVFFNSNALSRKGDTLVTFNGRNKVMKTILRTPSLERSVYYISWQLLSLAKF
jgi:hypothetical protein